jgi:hypothetical protein
VLRGFLKQREQLARGLAIENPSEELVVDNGLRASGEMVQVGQAHAVDARRVAAFPATPNQPRHVEQEWGVVSHSGKGESKMWRGHHKKCDARQRAFC